MLSICCSIAQAEQYHGYDSFNQHMYCHLDNTYLRNECNCYCHKEMFNLIKECSIKMNEWE